MVGWLVGSVLEVEIGGVGVVAALPGFFRLGVVDSETSMLAICNKTLSRTKDLRCFLIIINNYYDHHFTNLCILFLRDTCRSFTEKTSQYN